MNRPTASLFFFLLGAVAVFGCKQDEVFPSAPPTASPLTFTDLRLVGAWYDGYTGGLQFTHDGIELPLTVDRQNTLQVDGTEGTSRYRTPVQGVLVVSSTYYVLRYGSVRDTSVEYSFSYDFTHGDSTLSLLDMTQGLPVPPAPQIYVRKAIGSILPTPPAIRPR